MRTPRNIGTFNQLVEDIGLSDREIARHLGTTIPSVRKYREKNFAHRTVLIALFWESQWGRQTANLEAADAAMYHRGYALALEKVVADLRSQIATLEQELEIAKSGDAAANMPIFRAS